MNRCEEYRFYKTIYQGILEDLLLSLSEKKSAKEAWEALKTMFMGADRVKTARIQTLKAEFESLNMKETEGVDEFAVKVSNIVSTMRALGDTVEESYVVKKLLRAVPSKFLQIASTLEQFGDLDTMTVEEVIGRLKAHEERMKGYGESDDRKLLLTHQEWSERNKKKGEGDFKSKSNRGGFGGSRGRGRGRGRNHGGRGRGRSGSYHQREGSQGASGSQDKSRVQCYNCQEYGHYAAECKNPRRERNHENNLIQEHHDDEPALLLSTFESNGDGGRVLLNEENVTPQLRTHGAAPNQSRVWYLDTGASNHMTGDKYKFKNLNEMVQGYVKFGNETKVRIEGKGSIVFQCKNGEQRKLDEVYYIPDLCSNIISLGQLAEGGDEIKIKDPFLWVHDGIGKLLMKDAKMYQKHLPCEGCLVGKQTRKTYPSHTSFRANKRLELVHGDLCGPISPPTPTGNRYFMLLVDDYSRVMWVYLLKTKDEALEVFKNFRRKVEVETGEKLKVLRTDRSVEMVRSMLKTMNVPNVLWGEAVNHVVYILNRVNWHMKILKGHLNKLDDRSMRLVHLGIEKGSKAYRLLDPDTGKLYVSRDVIFEEDQVWGWEKSTKVKATPGMSFTIKGFNTDEFYDDDFEREPNSPQPDQIASQSDSDWTEGGSEPINSPLSSQSSPQSIPINPSVSPASPVTPNFLINSPSTASSSIGGGALKRYRLLTDLGEWVKAMDSEMALIEKNNTWKLVDPPKNRKPIGLKWVYKVKRDPTGKIVKYKARIVAKGYVQRHGIDYEEVFAPVARIETVRLILALARSYGWWVHHLDVKSAFLNELRQGHGLHDDLEDIEGLGFVRCAHEYSVYTTEGKKGDILILVKQEDESSLMQEAYAKNSPHQKLEFGIISRFMEKPTEKHLQAVKRILRYVKGTLGYGLKYSKGGKDIILTGYTNSDLANDVNVYEEYMVGCAFLLNGNLITWASQKQRCVALSSCEAEFMAATMAACQGIWLRRLLSEITGQNIPPAALLVDNRSSLDLMKNPVFHGRSKHIDIRFHFIRECVENGEITVAHVCGKEQKADILTKPLARVKHEEMRNLMGIKKVLTSELRGKMLK
ncbi:zinc finger, CCHC-type containing protein [Tanacetum coccineum]